MNIPHPTDTQLKQALAKMLPDTVECIDFSRLTSGWPVYHLFWPSGEKDETGRGQEVLDTELLHLCWMVEQDLKKNWKNGVWTAYVQKLSSDMNNFYGGSLTASWQQRVIALCKVKGVEIV